MPKKTRKQKIISEKRREEFLLHQLTKTNTPVSTVKIEEKDKKEIQSYEKIASSQDKGIREYFISDFRKSIFIISLIIALEIVMYFGTINRYFH